MSGPGTDLVAALAGRVRDLVPRATSTTATPTTPARCCPALWLLASVWFRADVRGLHHVPREGPVLLVGNHTGGWPPPTVRLHARVHDLLRRRAALFSSPTAWSSAPAGPCAASGRSPPTPATRSSRWAGAAVLVFPGGDHEVFRPSWDQGKVDFGGRKG